jgi:hypothetical protein
MERVILEIHLVSIFSPSKNDVAIKIIKNTRGSPHSVLLAFFQSYVKHDLRKNKIVMASTTGFFRY